MPATRECKPMIRAFQIGGLVLACGVLCAADQRAESKSAPAPRPAPAPSRPANPPRNAPNKIPPARPVGAPLINPSNVVTRLYKASPEERDRALEKLPPKMQEQFRNQLKRFDSLTPAQQQVQLKWVERYSALPRQQQEAFKLQWQALGKMDPEQRRPITMALRRLEGLPDAQRRQVLESEDFKSRFSADERKMISDLSVLMLPPM
jgi:hypothetical protein